MIVAMATVHWQHGLFAQNNGIELPLIYSVAAAAIALIGNGAYSLDARAGPRLAGRGGVGGARPRRRRRIRESRGPQDRAGRGTRLNPERVGSRVQEVQAVQWFIRFKGSKIQRS